MIDYMRTRYIGTHYLLIIKGSVIPRVAPTALLGGLIAGLIAGFRVSYYDPKTNDHYDPIGEVFGHTYGMQLFGIVFGYLMVGRLNICYARYWEGVSHIKTMHSKWADAAAQVLAFDRIDDLSCDISDEDFCEHIVRARYTTFLFFPPRSFTSSPLARTGATLLAAQRDGHAPFASGRAGGRYTKPARPLALH